MKWTRVVLLLGVLTWGSAVCQEKNTGDVQPGSAALLPKRVGSDLSYPDNPGQVFPTNGEGGLDAVNWNEVVDYLLRLTNNRTRVKGRDEIALPDIHKPFTRKVGLVTLRGLFEARGGHLKGLSGVRRTGPVSVKHDGPSVTLTTSVGLRDPHLDYDFYKVDLKPGPSMSGSIEGEVISNSVEITATMELTDTACSTRLDSVKVLELSGLKVKVHRLGLPFDYLLSSITTWLTKVFKNDVHRLLQRTLTSELTKGLERSRCEKYATHFIFIDPK